MLQQNTSFYLEHHLFLYKVNQVFVGNSGKVGEVAPQPNQQGVDEAILALSKLFIATKLFTFSVHKLSASSSHLFEIYLCFRIIYWIIYSSSLLGTLFANSSLKAFEIWVPLANFDWTPISPVKLLVSFLEECKSSTQRSGVNIGVYEFNVIFPWIFT